jgi:hypothetical protein
MDITFGKRGTSSLLLLALTFNEHLINVSTMNVFNKSKRPVNEIEVDEPESVKEISAGYCEEKNINVTSKVYEELHRDLSDAKLAEFDQLAAEHEYNLEINENLFSPANLKLLKTSECLSGQTSSGAYAVFLRLYAAKLVRASHPNVPVDFFMSPIHWQVDPYKTVLTESIKKSCQLLGIDGCDLTASKISNKKQPRVPSVADLKRVILTPGFYWAITNKAELDKLPEYRELVEKISPLPRILLTGVYKLFGRTADKVQEQEPVNEAFSAELADKLDEVERALLQLRTMAFVEFEKRDIPTPTAATTASTWYANPITWASNKIKSQKPVQVPAVSSDILKFLQEKKNASIIEDVRRAVLNQNQQTICRSGPE